MSLPIGSVVTDVTLESLSSSNQPNVPFTFGQVFKQGDMLPSESLAGRIGRVEQPLQFEVKSTHADGSVRHAAISGVLPSLPAKASQFMQFVKVAKSEAALAPPNTPGTASVTVTLADVVYNATVDNMHLANATWLSGSIVQEKHFNLPLTKADGTAHPHLSARFALRDYNGNVRVDLTVENNWAFEAAPQSFTYDVKVEVNGESVYVKAGLNHYHHARWRKLFWTGAAPSLNVKSNTKYFIETRAVPNFDTTVAFSNTKIESYAGLIPKEVLTVGLANSYMPMTGGNDGIGIIPAWANAWLLSMDSRARDATLITGNGAGSYSMHYRDKKTDRPVTLTDHPRMTIVGRSTDAGVDAFPGVVGGAATPFTHDIAHQPSLVYIPWLLTCDYYYLEEIQFWALYDAFASNPGYRGAGDGLVIPEQLRGQAWALRTIAQAAYSTPDKHPLKAELIRILEKNLAYYNQTYSNKPTANKLGVILDGYAIDYENQTAMAPWMDDFFTSAVGHAVDLGFDSAKPLLAWKSKFPVGRMVAPGVCWITAAAYALHVRDTSNGPIYETLAQAYSKSLSPEIMAMPCGSKEMVEAWNRTGYPMNMYPTEGAAIAGDMGSISFGYLGYPSNMQPALAYAVDAKVEGAEKAWDYFMSRSVKPDYSLGGHFNIVPRSYVAKSPNATPPIEEPKMTFKVIVALSFANQTLPHGSEAQASKTLVEILAADGKTVVASSTDAYEFGGINAGSYVVRASGIDSKGAVMGVPYTQAFTIVEEVVVPPVDTTPVEVSLPAGVTVSWAKE